MKRDITVGYLKYNGEEFISNIIITDNFVKILSNFVNVTIIPLPAMKIQYLEDILETMKMDYLLIDIKNFSIAPFILREKKRLNIPFIIILRTVYYWLTKLIYIIPLIKKEDIIIASSRYTKNSFLRISEKFKIHVIPHCLDVIQISKEIPPNSKRNRNVMAYMGRLTKRKGIEILIDCMPKLISRVGDVYLKIIGPLSGNSIRGYPASAFVKRLKKKIEKLKLSSNVFFAGVQLGLDKYKILSEADIFVYPTIARGETFGFAIMEALACGIPVITTRGAGNRELIKEGENGYLINVHYGNCGIKDIDRGELISLLTKVFQNKKQLLRMKRKAHETALNYDFRKIMPRLIRLLKRKRHIKQNNSWKFLKNKTIIDFKDTYRKEIIFFAYFFGLADKTYLAMDNELNNIKKQNSNLGDLRIKENYDGKNTNKKLVNRINNELFKYLCIH